jgi:hypothetical protein
MKQCRMRLIAAGKQQSDSTHRARSAVAGKAGNGTRRRDSFYANSPRTLRHLRTLELLQRPHRHVSARNSCRSCQSARTAAGSSKQSRPHGTRRTIQPGSRSRLSLCIYLRFA